MTEARTTYREVFASRGYPALYSGAALGMVGVSLQVLAFSVAVYDATRNPFWSSPPSRPGSCRRCSAARCCRRIADRVPPRLLLPIGALVRAAVAAAARDRRCSASAAASRSSPPPRCVQPLFSSGAVRARRPGC